MTSRTGYSRLYSGAGETLTVDLTAANQSGIPDRCSPVRVSQRRRLCGDGEHGVGSRASGLVLSAIGLAGLLGYGLVRRRPSDVIAKQPFESDEVSASVSREWPHAGHDAGVMPRS